MRGLVILLTYIAVFTALYYFVSHFVRRVRTGLNAHKTVTFGDESTVVSDRIAGVLSVLALLLLWAAFTGSSLTPSFLHAPAPFQGTTSFEYTAQAPDGKTDTATVTVLVHPSDEDPAAPEVSPKEGFAQNDSVSVPVMRSQLIRVDKNDELGRDAGVKIVAVDGMPLAPGGRVEVKNGSVGMSSKGTLNFEPKLGWQMESIWLPSPEKVVNELITIAQEGYRGYTLLEHYGFSLFRVLSGFFFGALVGIPLGYAMGLSNWFRGWFEPIVEFMRPVPPLALIPLVIIWAGIGEVGKIILLFLAALWIMAIAARSGVSAVRISKIHAAYSLGATKSQIMRYVIIPNSLPEIFTGARVAMGVCWGTVVAAELVAAEKGAGMMIMVASKFQLTHIVILGIILIGIIGFSIDIFMRWIERLVVPWKGKG